MRDYSEHKRLLQEALTKQYKKERKKILNRFSYAKKKGFTVDRYNFPEFVKNPSKQDIRRLQIYASDFSYHILSSPNTIYDGAGLVISNFKHEISRYPKYAKPTLTNWLNESISQYGETEVARMLNRGYQNGYIITREIAYDETELYNYTKTMMEFLEIDGDTINNTIENVPEEV